MNVVALDCLEWMNNSEPFKDEVCGIGGIFRGVNSSRLPNIHYSRRFISSALMAEAIAVRSAVMKAASSNIRSLTVYSDSRVLISMIKTKETRPALYGILFDIFYFSSLFETISFMFIPRLENSEADLVAKSALAAVDNLSVDGV
uniref:RNase H type-1 domain-containing protein n=1 Tax=Brassica oleracea var. oleracea TaxID=109376 RepID=A0A0D3D1Y2_BRAOL